MTSWVRLWHDMPTDPKWRTIARKSGQRIGDVIAVFTFALVNASANEIDRGALSGFDPEDVGSALDLEAEAVAAIVEAMRGKVLAGDRLAGWDKRQPKREREDDSAQRVREFRKRKQEAGMGGGDDVTPRNAEKRHVTPPDTDTDTDSSDAPGAPEAPASAAAKKEYAFQGNVIRLTAPDLERWAKTYHAIPDMRAELASLDAWLRNQPEAKRRNWFQSVSGCLNRKHQEMIASRTATSNSNTGNALPMVAEVLARKQRREAHKATVTPNLPAESP